VVLTSALLALDERRDRRDVPVARRQVDDGISEKGTDETCVGLLRCEGARLLDARGDRLAGIEPAGRAIGGPYGLDVA
jgi:hypothetical protein